MIFSVKSPILGFEHIKTMELIELDKFFVKLASKDDEKALNSEFITLSLLHSRLKKQL